MSSPSLCRLCANAGRDYKSLYHDSGHGNDLYELTLKYFHPKIVDLDKAKHLTGICVQCCRHIYDFHGFQESVLAAQSQLVGDYKYVVVKLENVENSEEIGDRGDYSADRIVVKKELISLSEDEDAAYANDETETGALGSQPTTPPLNRQIICKEEVQFEVIDVHDAGDTHAVPHKYLSESGQASHITLPKLELTDVHSEGEFHSDDEMPLVNIKKESGAQVESSSKRNTSSKNDFYYDSTAKLFRCKLCPNSYPFRSSIKHHVVIQHLKTSTATHKFKCNLCENSFSHKNQLTKHIGLHHTATRAGDSKSQGFKCSFCDKLYAFQNSMQRHMRRQHSEKFSTVADYDVATNTFKCRFCDGSFLQRCDLTAHVRQQHPEQEVELVSEVDGNPPVFKCELCGSSYNLQNGLQMHMARKHPEACKSGTQDSETTKLFKCDICGSTYKIKRSLKLHMESKHPESLSYNIAVYDLDACYDAATKLYICKLCGNSFPHKKTLSFHMGSKHGGKQRQNPVSSSQNDSRPRIKCNLCHSTYLSRHGLRRHMKSQHPDKVRPKLQFIYDATTNRFKCTLCDHSYTDKSNLRAHIRNRHDPRPESHSQDYDYDDATKMFKCKLCGNSYMYKNKLLLHLTRQHSKTGTNFQCTQCPKEFVTRLGLKCHYKSYHVASGAYACKECGKKFKKLFPLHRHMYYHKVKPKHKCATCDQAFKSPYQLRIHLKRGTHHHGLNVMPGNPNTTEDWVATTTAPLGVHVHFGENIQGNPNEQSVAVQDIKTEMDETTAPYSGWC